MAFHYILGQNASGKTLLIRRMLGAYVPEIPPLDPIPDNYAVLPTHLFFQRHGGIIRIFLNCTCRSCKAILNEWSGNYKRIQKMGEYQNNINNLEIEKSPLFDEAIRIEEIQREFRGIRDTFSKLHHQMESLVEGTIEYKRIENILYICHNGENGCGSGTYHKCKSLYQKQEECRKELERLPKARYYQDKVRAINRKIGYYQSSLKQNQRHLKDINNFIQLMLSSKCKKQLPIDIWIDNVRWDNLQKSLPQITESLKINRVFFSHMGNKVIWDERIKKGIISDMAHDVFIEIPTTHKTIKIQKLNLL